MRIPAVATPQRFLAQRGWPRVTELTPLAKAGDLMEKHAEGILNYLRHPITNAAAEGINSIIQSLKGAAGGRPRFETFRTTVLFFPGKLDPTPA